MSQNRSSQSTSRAVIAQLAQPSRLADQHPVAARFIYALRLIALHDNARRDPVPELAARLGGVEIAAKALALAQAVKCTWPEDVHVSRFCCGLLSHDEATISAMIGCAVERDPSGFDATVKGLIRPDRIDRLWECVLDLATAELGAQ